MLRLGYSIEAQLGPAPVQILNPPPRVAGFFFSLPSSYLSLVAARLEGPGNETKRRVDVPLYLAAVIYISQIGREPNQGGRGGGR